MKNFHETVPIILKLSKINKSTSPISRGRIVSGEEKRGNESSILYRQVGVGGQLTSKLE